MSNPAKTLATCHACAVSDLELAPDYSRFDRVTSDCKPWPPGGELARCRSCGFVQTIVTPQFARGIIAGIKEVELIALSEGYWWGHQDLYVLRRL